MEYFGTLYASVTVLLMDNNVAAMASRFVERWKKKTTVG